MPNWLRLLVGSGDREKPLMEYEAAFGVENYFFMLQDFPNDPDWLDDEEDRSLR